MKKKILSFVFVMTFIIGFTPFESVKSEPVKTTITCPEGDKYVFYTTVEGVPVRKGKGPTTVVVESVAP
jgi:hypothetical protein